MDRDGYFTVRDIVDFAFCPRSIYFQYCIKSGKEGTPKMRKGSELHESFSEKSKRTKIVKELPKLPREFGLRLYSEKYNFNARIDCVLYDNDVAYPVEFKSSSKPKILYNTHKYQAVAQALVVEEILNKRAPACYIKYVDGITKMPVTPQLKQKVVNTLKQMEEIIKLEKIPRPAKSRKKCGSCFYKNTCRRI